jgi:uncharacterized glyoxalase superfamily protein PhnB
VVDDGGGRSATGSGRRKIGATVARTGGIVYLYVSDADALHARWSRAGADGRFEDPHDTDYGLREFGYTDPEGTVHRVGSPLASPGSR